MEREKRRGGSGWDGKELKGIELSLVEKGGLRLLGCI